MSIRRSLLVLGPLILVMGVALPAVTNGQGGPCSPSTPQYCPPPHVKTGPAKHVTGTTATLTGTVNPNGSRTTCFFRYGRTSSYGSTTPTQNVGSGTKPVKVSATVTGLMPGTTYHYRLVCQNRGGQAAGRDRKFKTKKQHVKTGPARNRHSTSGTLTGTVNPNGLATTCWFKYGRTKAFGSVTRNQSVGSGTHTRAVHATVHGLQPKTRYYDRLVCTSAAGRVRGGARTFATLNQIRFRGSHTITVSSTGRFVVDLHCNGNAHCAGVLTLTDDDGTVLARVHYVVDAHQTKHVHMRVTSSALQRLSRRHHLSGQLRARDLDSSSDSRRVRLVAG